MKNIKIILVDDHIVLRNGLKLLLESEQNISIVGEASSYSELKTILQQTPTDILLLDLSIPDKHGLEIIKELKDSNVNFKILVFTMYSEEQYIKSAMSAGASGYVEKSALDTELLTAINTVAQGNIYLNSKNALLMVNSLLNTTETNDPYALFSNRELEVMKLMVHGYSLSKIGQQLCLSLKTIDTYKTRIFTKLNISKKNELVDYALQNGILKTSK